MNSNFVVHFEIPVTNMNRAVDFYTKVFNTTLTLEEIDGYHMALFPRSGDLFGASGALVVGDVYHPSIEGCFIYFAVESIDEIFARALSEGKSVLYPKTSLEEHGYVGEIQDSEGNRIGLREPAKQ